MDIVRMFSNIGAAWNKHVNIIVIFAVYLYLTGKESYKCFIYTVRIDRCSTKTQL